MNKDLRVTLFSNSAPVFYTVNGKAYCDYLPDDENYVTNLEPERYADFAKYSIACAKHFTEAGYRVTGLSPINEPEWSWRGYEDNTAKQEGCYYSKTQCRDLYKVFFEANGAGRRAKGLPAGRLGKRPHRHGHLYGIPPNHVWQKRCQLAKNNALRKGMPTLALHSYWASPEEKQAFANAIATTYGSNYKLALTEYCQMTEDQNSGVYDLIQKERYGQRPGHGIRSGTGRDHSSGSDGAKRGRMGLVDRLRLWRLHRRTGVSGQRQPSSRDLQAAVGTGQLLQIHRRG